MLLNEKRYCFTVLMFCLFAVVCLLKSVRDKLENIPVTIGTMTFAGLLQFYQLV
jgi:uncharacterized membrane protein YiaA